MLRAFPVQTLRTLLQTMRTSSRQEKGTKYLLRQSLRLCLTVSRRTGGGVGHESYQIRLICCGKTQAEACGYILYF